MPRRFLAEVNALLWDMFGIVVTNTVYAALRVLEVFRADRAG